MAIPFFLYRTGNSPVTSTAGVRSMFAFWMGGATFPSATTTAGMRSMLAFWQGGAKGTEGTPVPPETGGVGSSISGGTFSRGRWHDLKAQWKAQRALHDRACKRKRRRECEALEAAAQAAAEALEAAEASEAANTAETAQLTVAMQAALAAKSLNTILARCRDTLKAAEELRQCCEDDEEETIVMYMLLH